MLSHQATDQGGSGADRPRVVLVDRAGYHRYRMPDGGPVLDPRHYRVSLLTRPELVGQPGPGECAEILGYDIDDERLTGEVIELCHRDQPIDRLIAFPENLLLPVAEARQRLGVPGPTPAEILPFRDKPTMKLTASGGNLAVADWRAVEAAAEARDLLARHGRIILKPRDGAGSAGVYPVGSPAELAAITADLSGYQAEGFIDAPMIHVDAVVVGGAVLAVRTSRYLASTLSHLSRRPLGSVVSQDPALTTRAGALLDRVIEVFSIKEAVLHLEAFVEDDRLVFNEVACRAGGGGIVALMQALTGYNLFEAMVRLSLGEQPTGAYPVLATTGGFVLMYGEAGILEGVDDERIPAEWILERRVAVPVGGRYTPVGRAGGSLVSYLVCGEDEAEVERRIRTIQETVAIRLRRD